MKKEAHEIICGATGCGKNNYLHGQIMECIRERKWGIDAYFPHEEWGGKLVADIFDRYGKECQDWLIVERLRDPDKFIPHRYLLSSDNPDLWKRRAENDAAKNHLMEMMARERGQVDFSENPVLQKYTDLMFSAVQNCPLWVPPPLMHRILRPGDVVWHDVKNTCTDEEIRSELEFIVRLPLREQLALLEPVRRMCTSFFRSVPIYLRSSQKATFDTAAFFNKRGVRVTIGGGVSDTAFRLHYGANQQELINLKMAEAIHKNVWVVRDESIHFGLVGAFESRAWSTCRFIKLFFTDVIQSWGFEEEISQNGRQNCNLIFFRQGDFESAKVAAECMLEMVDEHKIHHVDEFTTMAHAGFDEVQRVTKTTRDDGGTSEAVSPQMVARYEPKTNTRNVYQNGNEQILFLAQAFQKFRIGQCRIVERGSPPIEKQIEEYPTICTFTGDMTHGKLPLWRLKAEECIAILKELPCYVAPQELKWISQPRPAPPPNTPKPKRGAASKSAKKGKGP